MRADEMVKQLQDQANLYSSADSNIFAEHIEKLESSNKKLQNDYDTVCIKYEKEKQEIISQAKKTEYSLIEDNSKKDIEIQRLKLDIQRITIEKDGEFEKLKNQMEVELRDLKDMYTKEKCKMDYQLEQASIQAKALQLLNTKELFMSQVRGISQYFIFRAHEKQKSNMTHLRWISSLKASATASGSLNRLVK